MPTSSPPYLSPSDKPPVEHVLSTLADENPSARDFLCLWAFLAPQPIPFLTLRDGRAGLPKRLSKCLDDGKQATQSVQALLRRGLAVREANTLSVSREIQHAVRNSLHLEERRVWSDAALGFLKEVWPEEKMYAHSLPACDALLDHMFAATHYAEQLKVNPERTGTLLNLLGLYLHGCGDYARAERCYHRGILQGQAAHGPGHEVVGIRWNNLGVVHQGLNNRDQARTCFETSIRVLRAVNGDDDETLLQPSRNLFLVLVELEEWEAARVACGDVMNLYLEQFAFHHPLVAECANTLGTIWRKLGNTKMARKSFDKAILSASSAVQPEPDKLASYRLNYGIMLLEEDSAAEAEEEFSAALELYQTVHGKTNLQVARCLNYLGQVAAAQHKIDDAQKLFEQAYRTYKAVDDAGPRELVSVLNQVYKLHVKAKRTDAALTCLRRMLELDEQRFGPESVELTRTLVKLGKTYAEAKETAEAARCYERLLAIQERAETPDREVQALALHRLGRIRQEQASVTEAIAHFTKAAALNRELLGEPHATVARDAYYLGCAMIDAGDELAGLGHLGMALRIYEETVGPDHPSTRRVRKHLQGGKR